MSETKRSYSNFILSFLAISVAFGSLIVSIRACELSEESLRLSQQENLSVVLDGISNVGKVELHKSDDIMEILYWKCILNNVGNKNLSIVDFDAFLKSDSSLVFISTDFINQGIFDDSLKPVNFPIRLDGGDSKIVYVKIAVPSSHVNFSNYDQIAQFGTKFELEDFFRLNNFLRMGIKIEEGATLNLSTSHAIGWLTDTSSSVTLHELGGEEIDTSNVGEGLIKVEFVTGSGQKFSDINPYRNRYINYFYPDRIFYTN
jgi:hypothetical protein